MTTTTSKGDTVTADVLEKIQKGIKHHIFSATSMRGDLDRNEYATIAQVAINIVHELGLAKNWTADDAYLFLAGSDIPTDVLDWLVVNEEYGWTIY